LDFGANLQAAADMGRFRHSQIANTLNLETPLYELVGSRLAEMGHVVKPVSGEEMGGVQILMRGPGYYRSGSDFRKDGQAVGW